MEKLLIKYEDDAMYYGEIIKNKRNGWGEYRHKDIIYKA